MQTVINQQYVVDKLNHIRAHFEWQVSRQGVTEGFWNAHSLQGQIDASTQILQQLTDDCDLVLNTECHNRRDLMAILRDLQLKTSEQRNMEIARANQFRDNHDMDSYWYYRGREDMYARLNVELIHLYSIIATIPMNADKVLL